MQELISKAAIDDNTRLNSKEFSEKNVILESYPRSIFIQLDAPCNQDCIFCSRPDFYRYFNLAEFELNYGKKLEVALSKAERINLTGSGELLLLPEAKKILDYFNQFKYAEKMFASNGSTLTPKMADHILESENSYVIHVSLHSTTPDIHEIMTRSKNYKIVKHNLAYLKDAKKRNDRLKLNLIFLATARNIDNLPDFVDFAAQYEANSVVVYYNYVYRLEQKDISCYFIKEKTNDIFDLAKKEAEQRNIQLILPPKFNMGYASNDQICCEAWTQMMINPKGDIITCDVAGDDKENLNKKEFMEAWNSEYYTRIRNKLLNKDYSCAEYCFRANPASVDHFMSHIITRGKTKEEINMFLEGS